MSRYRTRARDEEPEEEERRPRYGRRQSSGIPPAVFGMLVIVIVSVAAIILITNVEKKESVASTVDETDPFEGLPPDIPPEPRNPRLNPVGSSSDGGGSSVFAGLEDVRDDPVWLEAKRIAEEGRQLGLQAGEAQEAGNVSLFRERAKLAKEKYNLALEKSYQFEQDIARDNGWDHPDVRRVGNRRTAWTRALAEFKKMGGI